MDSHTQGKNMSTPEVYDALCSIGELIDKLSIENIKCAWANHTVGCALNGEIGAAREDGVDVSSDENRRRRAAGSACEDAAQFVDLHVFQSQRVEFAGNVLGAFAFFKCRRGDLLNGNCAVDHRRWL